MESAAGNGRISAWTDLRPSPRPGSARRGGPACAAIARIERLRPPRQARALHDGLVDALRAYGDARQELVLAIPAGDEAASRERFDEAWTAVVDAYARLRDELR
jgi:hypothetical protein